MRTSAMIYCHSYTRLPASILCMTLCTLTTETPTSLTAVVLRRPLTDCIFSPGQALFLLKKSIFTWTSLVPPKKVFDAAILVNGQSRGLGNCNNELNPGLVNCANTVPLVLKAGDKINVRTTNANFLIRIFSSFKG